jgi:hypothetical protein
LIIPLAVKLLKYSMHNKNESKTQQLMFERLISIGNASGSLRDGEDEAKI